MADHSKDSSSLVEREGDVRKKQVELNTRKRKLERLEETEKVAVASTHGKLSKQSSQDRAFPTTNITSNPDSGCYSIEQDVRGGSCCDISLQDDGMIDDAHLPTDHLRYTGGKLLFSRKWHNLKNILTRMGPFRHPNFKPSPSIFERIKHVSILVVGVGGLGCEILKNLAMMGFANLSVIDMDTVDLSNLNRQFLFRRKDIGHPKAEVAADYLRKKIFGCDIKSYYNKIEDFDHHFYQKFHIIICGLDTINARKWLNGMLLSLLTFDGANDELNHETVVPFIDGGTEGFKGTSRIILPGISPCIDCAIDLYPPQKCFLTSLVDFDGPGGWDLLKETKFHLCTLANTPRLPEHCVEYVKLILWPRENPWGKDAEVNEDDPNHLQWIYEKSCERAVHYGIPGLNYGLVLGVLKNIIPTVASTNAVIGAACATEAFKIVTNCCSPIRNHMYFNNEDGVYTQSYELERKEQCSCTNIPSTVEENLNSSLENLIKTLKHKFNVNNPSIRANIKGKLKVLYMPTIPVIEERTRANLKYSLKELGFEDATEIIIADSSLPKALCLKLKAATQ